jgi:hypothetical protein
MIDVQVRPCQRAGIDMWPIEVAAASGRPDPVGHVKWASVIGH